MPCLLGSQIIIMQENLSFQVDEFHLNDRVRILNNKELVKRLQRGHGEWASEMAVVCIIMCFYYFEQCKVVFYLAKHFFLMLRALYFHYKECKM